MKTFLLYVGTALAEVGCCRLLSALAVASPRRFSVVAAAGGGQSRAVRLVVGFA
jgi:hypothetical protein